MSKIILYSHGGSGNHGCEAIVRGTYKILNGEIDELYSYRKEEDIKYGLGDILDVKDHTKSYSKFAPKRILASFLIRLFHNEEYSEKITYDALFHNVNKGDIALSIGGDNYCYKSYQEHSFLNKKLNSKNVKTVLWECSVEPSLIDTKMREDLERYSLIVARESISYDALKKVNKNVILCPDTAFVLDKQKINLPKEFDKDNIIGINISPVVIEYSKGDNIVENNFNNLINYIIENTQYKIALIPHVSWDFTNDICVLRKLYEKFKYTNRVILIEEYNSMVMKYIISKCRIFIGARTHATIAAYSSCVPTLVLGYSVKAKGIAKDLFGTYENYVISTQELEHECELIKAFQWICNNEDKIRNHLKVKIPQYTKKLYDIYKTVDALKGD